MTQQSATSAFSTESIQTYFKHAIDRKKIAEQTKLSFLDLRGHNFVCVAEEITSDKSRQY